MLTKEEVLNRMQDLARRLKGTSHNQVVIHTRQPMPIEYKAGRALMEKYLSQQVGRPISVIVEQLTLQYGEGSVELRTSLYATPVFDDLYL